MIQIEYLNEGTLVKHYSDQRFLLLQNETGAMYEEPIDIVPCQFTYSETNELIEGAGEISDTEALNIIVNGEYENEYDI